MVKVNHAICLFLVLMIFSHELVSIEARKLKHGRNLKLSLQDAKTTSRVARKYSASPSGRLNFGIKADAVAAFRPTTPGHSPGVGHAIHN